MSPGVIKNKGVTETGLELIHYFIILDQLHGRQFSVHSFERRKKVRGVATTKGNEKPRGDVI